LDALQREFLEASFNKPDEPALKLLGLALANGLA
jgi:hypothetical protein